MKNGLVLSSPDQVDESTLKDANIPLVMGGQAHTDKETQEAAENFGICALLGIALVAGTGIAHNLPAIIAAVSRS